VCGAKPTIEDDTNSLEATLLDELVANLSNVASVYHKRPAAFVDGKKLAPEVSLVYLLYWYKRTHTHTFFFKGYADGYEEAEEPEELDTGLLASSMRTHIARCHVYICVCK
jgi:hypothetical protein